MSQQQWRSSRVRLAKLPDFEMYTGTKFSTAVPARTGRTAIRVASARPHGLNSGIGSHGKAKRRALSSCEHIFAERNENDHDAICKDRKNCSQSRGESPCP